ncbi:hypothetical protein ACFQMH_31375 [Streptomyces viridiviolaceus]|uniref:Uncharacterized protein n=1 Tax=Streptomyces viridiviolaceus TaxID=68282 RepID=A0ABW2E7H3_9ACTN|nr:hypothetical protein [Streptomyces viridiviolaceus]
MLTAAGVGQRVDSRAEKPTTEWLPFDSEACLYLTDAWSTTRARRSMEAGDGFGAVVFAADGSATAIHHR